MNSIITKLEEEITQTRDLLAEAVKYSDAGAVLRLNRLQENQTLLLTLLKAKKEKRLDQVQAVISMVSV